MVLWCLATAASIVVASLALRPVLRTALPADSVHTAATEDRGNRQLITQTLPAPPSPTASPEDEPAVGDPKSAFDKPAGGRTTAPTTAPAQPRTTAVRLVDGWTVTTGADGVDVYVRSFRTGGGDAVVRIRAGIVSLVTATPRGGYSVSRGQTQSNRVLVQFVADAGNVSYIVDCMWWQNAPHGEVSKIGS